MKKIAKNLTLFMLLIFLITSPSLVYARAGGGDSYSSSSSSSSYSGSGSYSGSSGNYYPGSIDYYESKGDTLFDWLSMLAVLVTFLISSLSVMNQRTSQGISTGTVRRDRYNTELPVLRALSSVQSPLLYLENTNYLSAEEYRSKDKNFSRQAFLDFIQLLFVRYQNERGRRDFRFARFYMSSELLDAVLSVSGNNQNINKVIIGECSIADIAENAGKDIIRVRFETNYDKTELSAGTGALISQSFYSSEYWTFTRNKGLLSPPPEKLQTISCPSCGSTQEPHATGQCTFCHHISKEGDFFWFVENITIKEADLRRPIMPGTGYEEGTDLPTVFQKNFHIQAEKISSQDPEFNWDSFIHFASEVFHKIQDAWTKQLPLQVRPYETDHLYTMHKYWMDAYRAENKINVMKDIKILKIEPCRAETDEFYETITVRIFAKMKDYITINGKTLQENYTPTDRIFSEYWTFMRKKGVQTGTLSTEKCPNCGAPLQINAAGICAYCDTKITTGRFSWVLSMIEQDEAYETK